MPIIAANQLRHVYVLMSFDIGSSFLSVITIIIEIFGNVCATVLLHFAVW